MVLSDPVPVAAVALVGLLVVARLYAGSALLHVRFARFWGVARRIYMPVVDRVAKRVVGVSAENDAVPREEVGAASRSPWAVVRDFQRGSERTLEVSVLSGLKTDWNGNVEVASVVGYAGDRPFPGAPNWLRDDQIHVFLFRVDGRTRICAHREANSWRPDKWRDHLYKGESFDVQAGVRTVREWLRHADRER